MTSGSTQLRLLRRMALLVAGGVLAVGIVACGDDSGDGDANGVITTETATETATESPTEAMTATESPTEAMTATETATSGSGDASLEEQLASLVPALGVAFAVDRNPDDNTITIQTGMADLVSDEAQSICDEVFNSDLFPDQHIVILDGAGEQVADCGAS